MLGNFPITGIFSHSLGQNFDPWEIPKTHKCLGILMSGAKIGMQALKKVQNRKIWAEM